MNAMKIAYWYNILRVNYQLSMFEAIRYALWLTR